MMAERFLISYDPYTPEFGTDRMLSGDLTAINALGNLYIIVQPQQLQSAIQLLINEFKYHGNGISIYYNANALENVDDVISLLDNGAAKVFVSHKHLKEIVEGSLVADLTRLVLCLNETYPEKDSEDVVKDVRAQLQSLAQNAGVGIHIRHGHSGNDCKLLDVLREYERGSGKPRIYIEHTEDNRQNYVNAIEAGHVPIIAASRLTADPERFPDRIPAHFLLTAALRTDRPDGLYTTVVNDERGICLGLVYSDEESIRTALQTGKGVYYSRSRKALWIKGETSGDTQQLVSIVLDCDGDALRFTVRQKGTGRVNALCTYLSWLRSSRILPPANCNMFRSLLRPLTLATDTARP